MSQLKCPKCSREFVRRVVRAGLRDRLAGWFFIYPFKCQICGLRFYSLRWGVRYLRHREDNRDYDRLAMNFPLLFRGDRFHGEGKVTNISMGGCSFTTASKLTRRANMRARTQGVRRSRAGDRRTRGAAPLAQSSRRRRVSSLRPKRA